MCGFAAQKYTHFDAHLAKEHNTNSRDLWISEHGGIEPTCACGCGGVPRFVNYIEGFSTFIKGHITRKRSADKRQQPTDRELWLAAHDNVVPLCACGCGGEVAWSAPQKCFSTYLRGHSARVINAGVSEAHAAALAKRVPNAVLTCPACGYTTKRLTRFEEHLVETHCMTSQELWDVENDGPPRCPCGCDETPGWVSYSKGYQQYVFGHHLRASALGPERAADIRTRKSAALKKTLSAPDYVNPMLGRTKDNDPIIAAAALQRSETVKAQFASGQRHAWSKGLTKDTDERVAREAEAKRAGFADGTYVPWAKGLSKSTDPRIAAMAAKVSVTHSISHIRQKLDAIKRLSVDEIQVRIEASGQLRVVGGLDTYVNDAAPTIEVACKNCGAVFSGNLRRLQYGRCIQCYPAGSAAQSEIAEFIRLLGVGISTNDRSIISPLELDIYVPEHKLAVEYNGLYWHSELRKGSTYHEIKAQRCEEAGIRLFHVFEDEWRDHRPIVESMLRHRLGISSSHVGARKCILLELTSQQRKEFFSTNHIDGDVMAMKCWGLEYNGDIVAALSVRRPFHKKHDARLEVARYCTALNTSVPGALSRLTLRALVESIDMDKKGLVTYSDTRLGGSRSYSAAGWKYVSRTPPRFWWTDFDNRFNRFKFRADSSAGMSESDVALEAGVTKIWGTGNAVYELDAPSV